jgi:hypothetical protein
MLIDARWQQHLIATLQLETLFESQHLPGMAANGRRAVRAHPEMHGSGEREVDDSHRLVSLLRGLRVGPDVVKASLKRNDATTARAATIIAQWMSYLPEDCVRAMVGDGWHWST